jgi:hypothetical protein
MWSFAAPRPRGTLGQGVVFRRNAGSGPVLGEKTEADNTKVRLDSGPEHEINQNFSREINYLFSRY